MVLLVTTMGIFAANAQTKTNANIKLVVLLNSASWCPICKANGPRVNQNDVPLFLKNKTVMVVKDNVTNSQTKAKSKPMLKRAGIVAFAEKHIGTGMLYFIDAQNKKLLASISMTQTDKKIQAVYQKALSSARHAAEK